MATLLRQQVQRSEGAYVEDHDSRFHTTGSPNHGCNESCGPHGWRPTKASERSGAAAGTKSHWDEEIVMAKVIEFHIPENFRKPLRMSTQPQLAKIIEFCPQTK